MATGTDRPVNVEKLVNIIRELDVAMMSTVEPDGSIRSRPMHTCLDGEFEGTLWFFTKEHSGKVFELDNDRHVNLSYACPKTKKYASVSGRGRIVHDRPRMERLWRSEFQSWFPQGLDDPDIALVRVIVDKAECWDVSSDAVAHTMVGDIESSR